MYYITHLCLNRPFAHQSLSVLPKKKVLDRCSQQLSLLETKPPCCRASLERCKLDFTF
jgi:hypothetical protein